MFNEEKSSKKQIKEYEERTRKHFFFNKKRSATLWLDWIRMEDADPYPPGGKQTEIKPVLEEKTQLDEQN